MVATVTAAFAEDPGWEFILGEEYERLAADLLGRCSIRGWGPRPCGSRMIWRGWRCGTRLGWATTRRGGRIRRGSVGELPRDCGRGGVGPSDELQRRSC